MPEHFDRGSSSHRDKPRGPSRGGRGGRRDETNLVPPPAFVALGLRNSLLKGVADMRLAEPSPLQLQVVPPALAGKDVFAQAKTGMGKTAALCMPLIQLLDSRAGLGGLVLVPNDDLGEIVTGHFRRLASFTPLRAYAVRHGEDDGHVADALEGGCQVLIGTPEHMWRLAQAKVFDLAKIKIAVVDELDRMIEPGWQGTVEALLDGIPQPRQTLLFSGTLPPAVLDFAGRFLREPAEFRLPAETGGPAAIEQAAVHCPAWDKYDVLLTLLEDHRPKMAAVLCSSEEMAAELAASLSADGVAARHVGAGRRRETRDRRGPFVKPWLFVATELAAENIDLHGVTHIYTCELPEDPQVHVQRCSRAVRLGSRAKSVLLVSPQEEPSLAAIGGLLGAAIPILELPGYVPSDEPPPERPRRESMAHVEHQSHDEPSQRTEPRAPRPSTLNSVNMRFRMPVFSPRPDSLSALAAYPKKPLGAKFNPERKRR